MSETAPAETAGETYLKEGDWQQLASDADYYSVFHSGRESCSDNTGYKDIISMLQKKLQDYENIKDNADDIVKNYCKASKMKLNLQHSGAACHFFYYWLGDLVWTNTKSKASLSGSTFLDVMKKIYEEFLEFKVTNNCNNMYIDTPNITEDLFKHHRIVFGFSFDYQKIKKDLQLHSSSCDKSYYDHLNEAFEAFEAVKDDCQGKNNTYCEMFRSTYDIRRNQNPLTLSYSETYESKAGTSPKGTTVYKGVQLELRYAPPSPSTNGSALPVAASAGTLIGVPFITFFLYKVIPSIVDYTSFSSWINNTLLGRKGNNSNNGNNRTKRRPNRRNMEIFTDISSAYSTETSTIYSADNSTIYNNERRSPPQPPQRRGRVRNDIPERRQRDGRRTNIRYHPT